MQRAARFFSYAALAVSLGVLILVAAATVPNLLGYHTYVVNGGSMEPSLHVGSAAVTKPTSPRALQIGDIIARHDAPGEPAVLHRVVDIVIEDGEWTFVTQGDRNDAADAVPVQLTGAGDKVAYSVPYVGYVLNFAGMWYGRVLLIGGPIILLAAAHIRESQRRTRRQAAVPAGAADPPPEEEPIVATGTLAPNEPSVSVEPSQPAVEEAEPATRLQLVTPETLEQDELPVFLRAQLKKTPARPAASEAEQRRVA